MKTHERLQPDVIELRKKGMLISEIAVELNTSEATVSRALKESGHIIESAYERPDSYSEAAMKKLAGLFREGYSAALIAMKLHDDPDFKNVKVTRNSVAGKLYRMGLHRAGRPKHTKRPNFGDITRLETAVGMRREGCPYDYALKTGWARGGRNQTPEVTLPEFDFMKTPIDEALNKRIEAYQQQEGRGEAVVQSSPSLEAAQ